MVKAALAALVGASVVLAVQAGRPEAAPRDMTTRGFPMHTVESAPADSRDVVGAVQDNFQMIPHVLAVMAESPALARSYTGTQENLSTYSTLNGLETNVVQMAISMENTCQYCVAGHTMVGHLEGQPTDVLESIRSGTPIADKKLEALRSFAVTLYEKQGRVSEKELDAFLDAGYTRAQALDVVAGIAAKVMTNFTNQMAMVPVDDAFESFTEGLPFREERSLKETSAP